MDIEIENEKYSVLVDTGADTYLTLSKEVLDKITKEPFGETKWIDLRGNEYVSPKYLIPAFKISDKCRFWNVPIKEENTDFMTKGSVIGKDEIESEHKDRINSSGAIGNMILHRSNLFFDLKNAVFFFIRDKRGLINLKREGYSTKNFSKVSFESDKMDIVFTVDTDVGEKKFALDTGATISLIQENLAQGLELKDSPKGLKVMRTSKFTIDGIDFGEMDLYLLKITDQVNIDGVLGMDFLMKHVIYIDFNEKKALIGPSKT